jgi:catechol 2,3-dioxygenase-like lactoylglutathione lyase family enzyme
MIGYVTLGTDDLARAGAYYDELLGTLGARRFMQEDRFIAWSSGPGRTVLCVFLPFDRRPASPGNGTMVALAVESPEAVRALHAQALSLGSADEGTPGPRPNGFYAGYFRDLDGNKLNVFCRT